MKSRIYSNECVKMTVKGTLWIPVFLSIGFLMAFPVAELIKLGNWFGLEYTREQIGMLYENMWKDGLLMTGFAVAVAAAAINGISQFWYLYSARKVDFYHCLPVKRRRMFWHKTYVSVLYYLIPYVVMEFLSVCIGAMRGFFSLHLMKLALIMLLIHLLIYLVLYFGVVLVITLTGNILMGGLCLGALVLYGPILSNLITSYQSCFFNTYYNGRSYGLVKILDEYVSPVRLGLTSIQQYGNGRGGAAVLLLLAVTAVLCCAGYFAYVKRSFEHTGKALVYSWTAVIIRFLVEVPAGLGIGIIFYATPVNKSARLPWWIFGMVAGTVLAHGIFEIIIQMDFRKCLDHKLQLLLAGGVVALCALNYQFDFQGYDSYIPKYDSIASVRSLMNVLGENFYDVKEENGYYRIVSYNYGEESGYGYDLGINQEIYRLLEEAAERTKQGDYKEDHEEDYYPTSNYTTFDVEFLLKSGKSIYRNYYVSAEQMEKLLLACYEEGQFKAVKYSSLDIDIKYMTGVSGAFSTGMMYALFQNDRDKWTELVEALKEDIKEADPKTLTEMPCAMLYFDYGAVPRTAKITSMVPGHSSTSYISTSFYIFPEFKRTLAILKETGYPLSLDEVSLDKVEVRYWIGDYGEETETITYDDPEQLQEIKESLVNSALCPIWKPYICDWSELNVFLDGEESESTWLIDAESYPEFMTEDEKAARPALVKYTEDTEEFSYDLEN